MTRYLRDSAMMSIVRSWNIRGCDVLLDSWEEDADRWDNQPWVGFSDGEEEDDSLWVVRRCPRCGRYISVGSIHELLDGGIVFDDWECKVHGDVEPFWIWGE